MTDLEWLFKWYKEQCDGDWEHANGIKMGTIDNPGCFLKISIEDTELQNIPFEIVDIERTEDDWLYCSIEENIFKGFGGVYNLPEILKTFRNWAKKTNNYD